MDYFLTKRKVAALAILIVGIVTSFAILSSDTKQITKNNPKDEATTSDSLLGFESIVSETRAGSEAIESVNTSGNATDNLTDIISEDIVNNKKTNISRADVDRMIEENTSDYFQEDQFTLEDVTVSESNSTQSKIAYLEKVDRDLHEVFEGFKGETSTSTIRKFLQEQNPEPLNYLISHIPNLLNRLVATDVPPSFTNMHLNLLNIWYKKLAIYSAIKRFEEDPLKAFKGVQELESVGKEDIKLQLEMIETYNRLTNDN